ncbi:hypothetical protein [Dysosmobacter sp.]|uniref:hypothetical protein n=1 Tax=Dysosmobacter sp. TaxID=2591382 RepID=UPI002A95FA90|nr:hypothetical protein [Dysosmobacter sp.]MDY5613430.1 hypothetical protein [Dysosmobacter sp.]
MGQMILVLILTCIICGGVPLLVFAYMNGKLKMPHRDSPQARSKTGRAGKSHPKVFLSAALVLGTFFGCFCFPVLNITKVSSQDIRLAGFAVAVLAYYEIGTFLAAVFPLKKGSVAKTVFTLLGFNCIHILTGMGCRYLLEFGEVSNTYNFTMPNIAVHLLAVNAVCLLGWYFQNDPRREK